MIMPKFEPVAQVVEELGTGKKVIFDSNKALYETPLWVKLYSADQLTEAYEAGKREQAAELAAEQAKNVGLRDELRRVKAICLREFGNGVVNEVVLSTPSDTSALEAMIAKAGEKMREKCVSWLVDNALKQSRDARFRSGIVIAAGEIRALPGVTLEDLK